MKKRDNWEQIQRIAFGALSLETEERARFLEKELDAFPGLRGDVESLIEIESEADKFFESPAALKYATFLADGAEEASAGEQIGNYRIVRELGIGGMGAVFLAERTDGEFDQRVAIKLLRREFNTARIRDRFEKEKQIQAALVHPGIARMIDAGTTGDGIPYLVMEYIEGEDIVSYCRRNGIPLTERLKLFNKVCGAVAFAHRNLVIHRDLKPSNILVGRNGEPKLLDFGISKLLTDELDSTHTVTRLGMMTPEYASPEQLEGRSVTTASDIYSLGVILYQLLTNDTPFDSEASDNGSVLSQIKSTEPEKPSSALERSVTAYENIGTKDDLSRSGPENRDSETGRPGGESTRGNPGRTRPKNSIGNPRLLRGDLDNIALKSLRKEPERRYATVEQLSEDIWRHLDGLPVSARPATLRYKASKFIRRNRIAVAAAGIIALAVLGGIVTTLWQAEIARAETAKARKMADFMQKVLNFSNPSWLSSNPEQNRNATIAEAMDFALERIETDLAGEPEIQAEILFALGKSYVYQGRTARAEEIVRRSIRGFDQVHGAGNIKSMQAAVLLADCLYLEGRLNEAEEEYLRAIDFFRPVVARDPAEGKWLAIALNDLGNIRSLRGDLESTESLYTESLKIAEAQSGDDRYMLVTVLSNMGRTMEKKGRFTEAGDYYDRAVSESRMTGRDDSVEFGLLLRSIGQLHTARNEFEKADEYYAKAQELLIRKAGEETHFTLSAMYNRALNAYRAGRIKDASGLVRRTLKIQDDLYPDGHYTIAMSRILLGDVLTAEGRFAEGESEIRKALEFLEKQGEQSGRLIPAGRVSLGANVLEQGREESARTILESALKALESTSSYEDYDLRRCRRLLSEL